MELVIGASKSSSERRQKNSKAVHAACLWHGQYARWVKEVNGSAPPVDCPKRYRTLSEASCLKLSRLCSASASNTFAWLAYVWLKSGFFLLILYSSTGFVRERFSCAAWCLASRRLRRLSRVGRVGLRSVGTSCSASSRSAMRSKATSRLAFCERRSVAVTVVPVGRWTRRTPVSTLLRCCPPGPLAIKKSMSQSLSRDARSVG